jgi:hypothetical protein
MKMSIPGSVWALDEECLGIHKSDMRVARVEVPLKGFDMTDRLQIFQSE